MTRLAPKEKARRAAARIEARRAKRMGKIFAESIAEFSSGVSGMLPLSQLVRSGRDKADPVAESVAAAAQQPLHRPGGPIRSSSRAPALRI
jgi:hypothetical protein